MTHMARLSHLLLTAVLLCLSSAWLWAEGGSGTCESEIQGLSGESPHRLEVSELQAMGIFIADEVKGLKFNGGFPFDVRAYEASIRGDKNRPYLFEHVAMRELSKEGESFLGIGDISVRAVIIPGFFQRMREGEATPTGADLLSVSNTFGSEPVIHIREVKSAPLEQVNLDKAISQMAETGKTLIAAVKEAHLAPMEVVMVDPGQSHLLLKNENYRLGGHRGETAFELEEKVDGQWVPKKVSLGDREVPIHVRFLSFQ